MSLQGSKTRALYERAKRAIPYGINSNFRYWGEDDTLVIERGAGAYIWDADGNRYIDYRLGFGPIILGHGYPEVVERVRAAIQDGTVFAWTTPLEIQVAERLCRLCKIDKVRLSNTGTEATMHALRLARAHTDRERFIKFEGQYHGMADYFLFSTASAPASAVGSRRSPIPVPASSGIPRALNQYVYTLPFNDLERLEERVAANWHDIAAIFVEPMLGNLAGILPADGFLKKIRELCDQYGIVMVMDEVKTGFRIAKGGAQEFFGVQADLVTYAKAMANGFPIAAIGGKNEIMMTVEPGAVAQGGTFAGNVVGTAAANATLEILEREPILDTIQTRGRTLMDGIREILTESGIPHAVTGLPAMFGIFLGEGSAPQDYRRYMTGDAELYEKIIMECASRGVLPDADGREPWFLCAALSEEDVSTTLSVFNDAVRAVKRSS